MWTAVRRWSSAVKHCTRQRTSLPCTSRVASLDPLPHRRAHTTRQALFSSAATEGKVQGPTFDAPLDSTRQLATEALDTLKAQALEAEGPFTSWVSGEPYTAEEARAIAEVTAESLQSALGKTAAELQQMKIFFDLFGFLHVPNFVSQAQSSELVSAMHDLVEGWDPETEITQFRTDSSQSNAQLSEAYFFESRDKVHFFAEPHALDEDTGKLQVDKQVALNKVGHGLHCVEGSVYQEYSQSPAVVQLTHLLGWKAPVLPQSMYIFKNPGIGGEVSSHQDSTFLFTEPRQTCLGMWLALHDARLDNGCLWVRPSSHLEPVRRAARTTQAADGSLQSLFEELDEDSNATVTWEGSFPDAQDSSVVRGLFARGFIPVEVKAGDLVCFPGTLDHLSLANTSSLPRHTFQLHLVEGPDAGVRWADSNWLQYPEGKSFPKMAANTTSQ